MSSKRCGVFAPWWSHFFLLLLALLAVVACPGGDNNQVSETVPVEPVVSVEGLCIAAFADATPASSRAFQAADQLALVNLSSCTPDAGGNLTISGAGDKPCGPNVVVDKAPSELTPKLTGTITIAPDGNLAFPDRPLQFTIQAIIVNGQLSVGTPICSVKNQITLTFTGSRPCDAPQDCTDGGKKFFKGIQVGSGGTLWMFGAKGVPTKSGVSWTYLSDPAGPEDKYGEKDKDGKDTNVSSPVPLGGSTTLQLATDVTKVDVTLGGVPWQKDDWITVATTSFSPFVTEFVQIKENPKSDGKGGSTVVLNQSLKFYHFGGPAPSQGTDSKCGTDLAGKSILASFCDGKDKNWGVDERAEVGLISRTIKLTSSDTQASSHWGGELKFLKGFQEVKIQGAEIEKFGKDQLGSYPMHFHMDGDVNKGPLVDANSIHHSYNKCITVHSTKNLTIQNNVCARIVGHIFYQEMGDEEGVSYVNNLGLGAMSNNFGLDLDKTIKIATIDGVKTVKPKDFYWSGDNLANAISYDGRNIPNSDDQKAPTHGDCKCVAKNGEDLLHLGYPYEGYHTGACDPTKIISNPTQPDDDAHQGGIPVACDQAKGELYTEPASGFWIVNPGTELIGNSIGGCQGVGRAYWYVPPGTPGLPPRLNDLQFKPLGRFLNNRAHGCYAGLYAEGENDIRSQQLFPRVAGQSGGKSLIGNFDGLTATRMRDRGVWLRPVWHTVKNSRFATNRDSVSLVTSGGLDGNAPGVWLLLTDSVVVGVSRNNVDRWGPCPNKQGTNFGCIDGFVTNVGGNPLANDVNARGYPNPDWNFFGYLIYDGPVRIVHNRFVNFKRDPSDLLTTADKAVIKGFTYGKGTQKIQSYEGDAVFGWFNANQSAYPTSTVSKHLLFENVDLRHQIFTEEVNLDAFKDGDKNTAILDEDGTLSGFQVVDKDAKPLHDSRQFPISLNNLEFNRASNAVDECLSEGQQDTVAEKRPTSLMSPANMATLEFQYFKLNTVPLQDITFTKDSLDYGKHQFMTLTTGRNGQYLAEPKVASGFGYTITGMKGIPEVVHLGLTDAVKPDIIAPTSSTDPGKNPFFVRVGVCFTGPTINGKPTHPQDATKFTIDRGYKSWGGNGVNFADPDLKKFFVHLDPDHSYRGPEGDQIQHCLDLDVAHQDNLSDTTNGCPADGVTKVPDKGDCPFPSFKDKAGGPSGSTNEITACIYPATTLTQATTIADLKKGGLPDPTKYFYDPTTGWLFFYVVQEFPNPIAGSPLGSCSADGKGSNDDPACPDVKKNESFYACPAQGCVDYVVRLDDSTYKAASSDCGNPYPIGTTLYQQDPPANQNRLAYKGGANDGQMVKDCRDQASKLGFDHSVAGDGQKTTDGKETCVTTTRNPPSCPLTTP